MSGKLYGVPPQKVYRWRELLVNAAAQFREYEALHLAKVDGWTKESRRIKNGYILGPERARLAELDRLIADTTTKARTNAAFAAKIEKSLWASR